MKIYHGSKVIVRNPKPFGSSDDNDYGPAFYATIDLKSAHEWACRKNNIGIVNVYDFDLGGLNVLNLTDTSKYSVLNWVAILLHFRTLDYSFKRDFSKRLVFLDENYYIDVTEYDLVIGPRADDAYFRFPLDFVRGNLTLDQLDYAYSLGDLGYQYVLMSEKAFRHLKFKEAFESEQKYIDSYYENVKRATNDFNILNKDEDGIRIQDIMKGTHK